MEKSIAVIIPALNEEATIADVVTQCLSLEEHFSAKPIVIVVNDGSTDSTEDTARKAGARVVSHAVNLGVGRAFRTGLVEALSSGADVVVNIDADGQFDPLRIPDLIRPILTGRADFTTASRFKDPALVPDMPRAKLIGNRLMSYLISRIAHTKFYDVSCGFRAYNRSAALRLSLWGEFTYTQESILDLVIKNMRIEEVPMRIQGVRSVGESRVASNLFTYGWRSLKIIFHAYRDFWPLQFFGTLSLLFITPGFLVGCFFVIHRFVTGRFSPHIWAGFTAAGLLAFGFLICTTGLIGEMLKRIRLNQEMLLYHERRKEYAVTKTSDGDSAS